MSEPSQKPKWNSKTILIPYLVGATGAALFLWGGWALEHFTDFRFKGADRTEPIDAWFAIVGTLVAYGVALIFGRRAAAILEHGVETAATIVEFGMAQSGMQHVTLSYHHNGEELKTKISASQHDLEGKHVGDRLDLIVDSRNPKRVMVK